ncbi:MAG: DEAD/DEAH box helicase [Bacillota bacterium]
MADAELRFPLYERAQEAGVLDGGSALIVAPTGTGKSFIGRQAIVRALQRGTPGTHAYLVPFRALADEVYTAFSELLESAEVPGPASPRLRIVTGDHRDPVRPDEADVIVATYESFVGLMHRSGFRPGVVVADEVHLVADDDRGPVLEGLFSRLLASRRAQALCGLSAVVENADELSDWLGVPLVQGTAADRPVSLSFQHMLVDDLDGGLKVALEPCLQGEQGLVFCNSRAAAERAARELSTIIQPALSSANRRALITLAGQILEQDPDAEDAVELLTTGVAYHHAGLPRTIRRAIETAFRDRPLRVIAATPTLAAGVNLPAGVVVVRDIFRPDVIRGVFRYVLLPSGEVLNMLGRAARPHQVRRGVGIALIEKRIQKEPKVQELLSAIAAGRGGVVTSRLPESFEGLMRFVLGVVAETGDTTREDVARAFEKTLAYHADPRPIRFDRSFEEDIMEDIPAYEKVVEAGGSIRLAAYRLSAAGVDAVVRSRENQYTVTISVTGLSCTCPAASQFYRGRICKHEACAIHDLLFSPGIDEETRTRTIYNCGHVFGKTLDLGTRLGLALRILTSWRLIERVPGGWHITPIGDVAAASGFDLLLVRQAIQRVEQASGATYRDVARWAVEDYQEKDRVKWVGAVERWIDEVSEDQIHFPVRHRGDFERALDDLSQVCLLYEKAALALGKPNIAEAARAASGVIRYGVAPELVPLMGLGLPQLGRARSRYLFERGVRNLQDLVQADPAKLSDPRRAPEALVRQWVERAREIHKARAVALADREEADEEFDELVSRFRIDPAALR